MSILQIILLLFLGFALSRVILRYTDYQIKTGEFIFWFLLFFTAIVGVIFPEESSRLAQLLGIGRGVDLIVYASIATLFYLVFRIYVLMEDIRHEITKVVRQVALERGEASETTLPRRIPSKRKRRQTNRRRRS